MRNWNRLYHFKIVTNTDSISFVYISFLLSNACNLCFMALCFFWKDFYKFIIQCELPVFRPPAYLVLWWIFWIFQYSQKYISVRKNYPYNRTMMKFRLESEKLGNQKIQEKTFSKHFSHIWSQMAELVQNRRWNWEKFKDAWDVNAIARVS